MEAYRAIKPFVEGNITVHSFVDSSIIPIFNRKKGLAFSSLLLLDRYSCKLE
jgi:hypothetical protein